MNLAKILPAYLMLEKNIVEYGRWAGGDSLLQFCERFKETKEQAVESKQHKFLLLLEQAKSEWQFSMKLLTELTDPDLIDYGVYLIKANEAKYRYLLKLARKERIKSKMWQAKKIHDI